MKVTVDIGDDSIDDIVYSALLEQFSRLSPDWCSEDFDFDELVKSFRKVIEYNSTAGEWKEFVSKYGEDNE